MFGQNLDSSLSLEEVLVVDRNTKCNFAMCLRMDQIAISHIGEATPTKHKDLIKTFTYVLSLFPLPSSTIVFFWDSS